MRLARAADHTTPAERSRRLPSCGPGRSGGPTGLDLGDLRDATTLACRAMP